MTGLDYWLKQATCNLAAASAAQVRREIQEHYELAREAAIAGGADSLCGMTVHGFAALELISPTPCRPCARPFPNTA